MKKALIGLILSIKTLFGVVSGDSYEISVDKDSKYKIIFTDEHKDTALKTSIVADQMLKIYERSYGFSLDDTLYITLASSKNQIANAFSTQFPLNMQQNYIGGGYLIDYMSSTSWIVNLLFHESAHNFQLNAKKNYISKVAHKIVKNTPLTYLLFVPIFPVPNILESSFLIEGNAVLNESRFNNGGRLYNGAHLAMAITQAKAGYITPKRVYNSHLCFPYNTHHYIVGGFFQLFLAQKYGIDKTNRYFWNLSGKYPIFMTTLAFRETFNSTFTDELKEYANWLKEDYKDFKATKGNIVATSKKYKKLNSDTDEIYFLTSDDINRPQLIIYNKKESSIKSSYGNYKFGKVFKVNNRYYTLSSGYTEAQMVEMALFDKNGRVYDKSRSKIIQDTLPDGRFLYFDAKNSFLKTDLFIEDRVYDSVNSSVYSSKDGDIYYFKQKGKVRTLYKNKKAIFSYLGWYGFVVDTDGEKIYFISNSKNGTTLYMYYKSDIYRVLDSDDVVDAKLIDKNSALVATIGADYYSFIKTPLKESREDIFERELFFEKDSNFNISYKNSKTPLKSKKYRSYQNLKFSRLEQHITLDSKQHLEFSLLVNFFDPLVQNSVTGYITNANHQKSFKISYANSANRLKFSTDLYHTTERDKVKHYGTNISLLYPIYKESYRSLNTIVGYNLNSKKDEKQPLSLVLEYKNSKQFAKSLYSNRYNRFLIFGVDDRGDNSIGFEYKNLYHFGYGIYGGVRVKYAKSNTEKVEKNRGITLDHVSSLSTDPSQFIMPSLREEINLKEALLNSLSLYYVVNLSAYSFNMPLSLRRESIYLKYSHYNITTLKNKRESLSEYRVGLTLDMLIFYDNVITSTFEYMQNSDLKNSRKFRVMFNLPF